MDAGRAIAQLQKRYPAGVEKGEPFRVLIQVMLSPQTTDIVSIPAAQRLLALAGTPQKVARLPAARIAKIIFPVGFYRTKARNIRKTCQMLKGSVPHTREGLMQLPGVGPKSAAIVLAYAFGVPTVAVDTHVNRISQRLGWVKNGTAAEKTQQVLERIIPEKYKLAANHMLVEFGRDICQARRPQCYRCPLYAGCKFQKKAWFKKLGNAKHSANNKKI